MRLFVGIALADEVTRELSALTARLRSGGVSVASSLRWTAPNSWHITLQFLGNATPEQYDCLTARLGDVQSLPVRVELGSVSCFDRAGVFIVDVAATPALTALSRSVMAATAQCGFPRESRPFHPHVTLARKAGVKGTMDQEKKKASAPTRAAGSDPQGGLRELVARTSSAPAFSRFTALEFLLYESHTEAAGARYEVRGRFPLQARIA
jgi:RNA 2',3'-cyclic 3'-phosphodiesterase